MVWGLGIRVEDLGLRDQGFEFLGCLKTGLRLPDVLPLKQLNQIAGRVSWLIEV